MSRIPRDKEIPWMNRIRCLNGAQLKWIAMCSMLIDHANKGILEVYLHDAPRLAALSNVLAVLGRVAFPIFLFLLAEGVRHSQNRLQYLLRLLGFALLSEIPYDMVRTGTFWDAARQNMFFTLALAMAVLWGIDTLRRRTERWVFPAILLLIGGAYFSAWAWFDYSYYGVLLPVVLYLFEEYRYLGVALSYAIIVKDTWSITGFALLNFYNGKRGHFNKWIGYWFYPLHLLVIGLIRVFILKA